MPMPPRLALFPLLLLPFIYPTFAIIPSQSVWRRANVPPEGYFNPLNNHGSMLTVCCILVLEFYLVHQSLSSLGSSPHLQTSENL